MQHATSIKTVVMQGKCSDSTTDHLAIISPVSMTGLDRKRLRFVNKSGLDVAFPWPIREQSGFDLDFLGLDYTTNPKFLLYPWRCCDIFLYVKVFYYLNIPTYTTFSYVHTFEYFELWTTVYVLSTYVFVFAFLLPSMPGTSACMHVYCFW